MIISHKYKFIFLKTNKTAGTSIEIALSKFCGPNDIITPISPEDEEARTKLGFSGPQNYLSPVWNYGVRDIFRMAFRGERKLRFYNHISAKEVKTHIGKEVWDSYYKFCFERNPWDRVISLYYWRNRSEPRPTISEFISSEAPKVLKERGYGVYTIDGKIAVDKVYKFENLADELEVFRTQIGLPDKLELPMAKSQYRKDKRSYRDLLSVQEKGRIAEMFRDEINLFGYEW
jgi:hypothetical protein